MKEKNMDITIMSSDKSDNKQMSNRMHGFTETASTTIRSPAISPYQRAIHSQTSSSNNNNNSIEQMMFLNQFTTTNITTQRTQTNQTNSESQTKPLTKAELRKSNKPIMEKKRRARINHCLNELKTLILEAMKKDPARHTKLEKADILEMTVKYLQNLHRMPSMNSINMPIDPVTVHRFRDGFSDCTNEVNRYINEMDGVDVNVKRRLMGHLSNYVSHIPHSNSVNGFASAEETAGLFSPAITASNNNNNTNNNNPFWSSLPHQMSSATTLPEKNDVQFIPSRLSSGELALIIPNSVNMNYFSATGTFSLNQLSKSMEQSTSFGASEPLKSKQTDTSPPLSPTSSISSNDSGPKRNTSDYYSSLENSFQTPQKPVPLFATSSSCNSSFEHSSFNSSDSSIIVPMALPPPPPPQSTLATATTTITTTTLQQQHVTSTTEPVAKFETDPANTENNSMWRPW